MSAVESDLIIDNFSLSPEVQQVMVDPGLKFDYVQDVQEVGDGESRGHEMAAPTAFPKQSRGVPPINTRDRNFAKRNFITK